MRLIVALFCLCAAVVPLTTLAAGEPMALVVTRGDDGHMVQAVFNPHFRHPLAEGEFDALSPVQWCGDWLTLHQDGDLVVYNYHTREHHTFNGIGPFHIGPAARYLHGTTRVIDLCTGRATAPFAAPPIVPTRTQPVWFNDAAFHVGHHADDPATHVLYRTSMTGREILRTSDQPIWLMHRNRTPHPTRPGDTMLWLRDGSQVLRFDLTNQQLHTVNIDLQPTTVHDYAEHVAFHDIVGTPGLDDYRARTYWLAAPDAAPQLVYETHQRSGTNASVYDRFLVWEGPADVAMALDMTTGVVQPVAAGVEFQQANLPRHSTGRPTIRSVFPPLHPWATLINADADATFATNMERPRMHGPNWQVFCNAAPANNMIIGGPGQPNVDAGPCRESIIVNPAQTQLAYADLGPSHQAFRVFDLTRWSQTAVQIADIPPETVIIQFHTWTDVGIFFAALVQDEHLFFVVRPDGSGLTQMVGHRLSPVFQPDGEQWVASGAVQVGRGDVTRVLVHTVSGMTLLVVVLSRPWARRQAEWW